MRIVLAGCSGMIGSGLKAQLLASGHETRLLVRPQTSRPFGEQVAAWDPTAGMLDPAAFEGADAVIFLGGANIAERPWSAAVRKQLFESRIAGATLISRTLATLTRKPAVFICASAIGYYGDQDDRLLTESSGPGTGFLAELCQAWEEATLIASEAGIRVVNARIGIVLDPGAGALGKMLTPFKFGLGGRIGSGRQFMSWIALRDIVMALVFCLEQPLQGAVNLVAPNPVPQKVFAETLARVLHRPAILPLPATLVSLLMGEMGRSILLASTRVAPNQLINAGFAFRYPDLEAALAALPLR